MCMRDICSLSIEGGECRALRGMRQLLEHARVIGMLIETGQEETWQCCSELVGPGGAFHTLWKRHHLCLTDNGDGTPISFDELCDRQPRESNWRLGKSMSRFNATSPQATAGNSASPSAKWPWEIRFSSCAS